MSTNTILASAPLTSTGYHLKANGTTLGNSLIWDNGTNVGIGNTNTSYTLDVSGTGRFTGNVGVGSGTLNSYTGYSVLTINNSTTGSVLDLNRNGVRTGTFYADTSGVGIGSLTGSNLDIFTGNSYIDFQTNGAERMRITSTGNVGIGCTPSNLLQTNQTGASGYFYSGQQSGTEIAYWYYDSSTIQFSSKTTRPLTFLTNDTERMRITSIASGGYTKISNYNAGYVNVNGNYHEINSNRGNDNIIYFNHTHSSSPYGPYIWFVNASPNNTTNYFLSCSDSTNSKAEIYANGTFGSRTGTYGSIISDEKYKTEIVSANSQWDDIKKLRVVNFKFKDDVELEGEKALRQIGFIAQEVEKVSPGLVYVAGKKDSDETWKSVKTSIIEIKAIKALQEAMARIETLESTIQNLQEQINILAK